VKSSDRIDTIAWQMYGDATHWRPIADHNRLTDPLDLRPGQLLLIPEEG
jgi:nucleoid-associated protein YgaU